MVDYNVVKICRNCKDRFTVNKSESKEMYCKPCKPKMRGKKVSSWHYN